MSVFLDELEQKFDEGNADCQTLQDNGAEAVVNIHYSLSLFILYIYLQSFLYIIPHFQTHKLLNKAFLNCIFLNTNNESH